MHSVTLTNSVHDEKRWHRCMQQRTLGVNSEEQPPLGCNLAANPGGEEQRDANGRPVVQDRPDQAL